MDKCKYKLLKQLLAAAYTIVLMFPAILIYAAMVIKYKDYGSDVTIIFKIIIVYFVTIGIAKTIYHINRNLKYGKVNFDKKE